MSTIHDHDRFLNLSSPPSRSDSVIQDFSDSEFEPISSCAPGEYALGCSWLQFRTWRSGFISHDPRSQLELERGEVVVISSHDPRSQLERGEVVVISHDPRSQLERGEVVVISHDPRSRTWRSGRSGCYQSRSTISVRTCRSGCHQSRSTISASSTIHDLSFRI